MTVKIIDESNPLPEGIEVVLPVPEKGPLPAMDDDQKYTDYMKALTSLEACPAGRFSLNLTKDLGRDFFKCKCRVCTSPPEFESFYSIKDWKVVEGVRKAKCLGFFGNIGDHWLAKQLATPPASRRDYFHEWTMTPEEMTRHFGIHHHVPEFPSFLDIAKNGVRMADRPKAIPGRRGMSFFQHPCDALEGLLPVFGESCLATVTDEKTGVTRSLDEALKEVRHKGESFPSPYLTHVYTVNPDE